MREIYEIIKKKDLPEDAKIVGVTTLKEVEEGNENKRHRMVNNIRVEYYKPGDKKGFIKGYVKIDGKDEYLQVVTLMPFIILMFAIIAGLIVIGLLTSGKLSEEHSGKTPLPLDPSQGEYVEPEKESKYNHSQNVTLPGWKKIEIPANETNITKGIDLYNPSKNHWYKCPKCHEELDDEMYCEKCNETFVESEAEEDCYYLMFTLYLDSNNNGSVDDNDEQIYQSGLVAPDKHIQQITINRPLEEGEYDVLILLQSYKSDMATRCNRGAVKLSLIAK